MWCRDVMTSCHDVTKPDLPISACRCARKLILFLFPWFFRSLSLKMLIIFHLYFAVTSWRHVMTSLNLIYLSQLVDVLESWFFFCFHGFFRSLSSKMPLTFYFWDSVTSWRHVMTSLNLIHLSQLVEELESSFFFCLHGFVGHWVQKDWWFFICMISWRHDVMSWRHKNCSTYLRLWIHWKDDRVQDSTVFLVAHSRNVSVHVFVGWYHVMTSRHDVTSILNITLQYLLIL